MEEEGIGFEIVAATLRADSADVNAFLPALAVKLSGALPNQTQVRYHSSLFGKNKTVEAVDVNLGDLHFQIEQDHGRLVPTRSKAVRGIVLKSEVLPLDVWINELSSCISEEAERSETGRSALQQMLEGS
jgi:hypothetical protein